MHLNSKKIITNLFQKKGKQEKNEKIYNQFILRLKKSNINPNHYFKKLFETLSVKITIEKISKKKEQVKFIKKSKQIKATYLKIFNNQNTLKNSPEIINFKSNIIKELLLDKKNKYKEGSRLV